MLLTRMSIKSRLLVLCLLPTIVIILLSANLVNQIQDRLHSYQLIGEKNASINLLTDFSNHTYLALSKRLNNQSGEQSIVLAEGTLALLHQKVEDSEQYTSSTGYIEELAQLFPELKHADSQGTIELSKLINSVYYDLYSVIISTKERQLSNSDVYRLDLILSDLSWLHFWMEREAWLVQEINVDGWLYPEFASEYFRVSERQQYYLDKFISLGADTQQVEALLSIFSDDNFQQGVFVKEQILYNRFSSQELQQSLGIVNLRNQLVEEQLIIFSKQLQNALSESIHADKQSIWMIASAGFFVFIVMLAWGASTLYRINSKLSRILKVMSNMRDSEDVEQIPVDGKDEFTRFARELNFIVKRQKSYQSNLLEAKETAEAANQAKSIFLANMSHEIRTPLNGIIGMTEILSESHLSASQKEILNDIDGSSHALLILINDILDLSKIESGSLALSCHNTNLRETVFDTLNMVNAQALKQEVTLELEFVAESMLYMKLDEFRVKQILMNLLTNAIKFSPNGLVKTRIAIFNKDKLSIEVSDTGVGIASEKLDEIFKPFTQEDGTITRRFGGTGLGLTICNQLVELMHGEIKVNSTVGEGSCFSIALPLNLSDSPLPRAQYSLKTLFISNQATHQQLAYYECERLGLDITLCDDINQARPFMDEFKLVIYCLTRHTPSRQDLSQLRTQFPSAELVGLQHHLYIEPDLEGLLTAQVILPILGKRFENVVSQCQKRAKFNTSQRRTASLPNEVIGVKRVLIVEDNLVNQKIASIFLSKVGIEYTIVSNGLEAVNAVRNNEEYGAILMDCMMPIMDGLTATKEIRLWEQEHNKQPVPIIALTASVLPEEIQSCFDVGMDAYLPKPYKSQQLFDIFEQLQVTF